MKNNVRHFLLILLIVVSSQSHGQGSTYHDWMNSGQEYFRFKVAEEGIYRVTYEELSQAGFAQVLSNVDRDKIQIFRKGTELAIKVNTTTPTFSSGDYIEFYGKPNDGTEDTDLYLSPSYQANKKASLFTDSAAYFLTVLNGPGEGKRIQTSDESSQGLQPESYYFATINKFYQTGYQWNITNSSSGGFYGDQIVLGLYDVGEGWFSNSFTQIESFTFRTTSINSTSGISPKADVQFLGLNTANHDATISVGPTSSDLRELSSLATSVNRFSFLGSANLDLSDFATDGEVVIQPKRLSGNIGVTQITLTYPRDFNFLNGEHIQIKLRQKNTESRSLLPLDGINNSFTLYDITDPNSPLSITLFNSNGLKAVVNNTHLTQRRLYLYQNPKRVLRIERVNIPSLNPKASNYIIISHPLINQNLSNGNPLDKYSDYRSSPKGGGFNVITLMIDEVYDMFNYGDASPIAIRRLAQHMIENGDPEYLFLIGRGLATRLLSINGKRDIHNLNTTARKNLIPTWGDPGTDVPFTAGLNGGSAFVEAIPTGRVNVDNPEELEN